MRLSEDPVKAARFHPDVTGESTANMTGRMCYEATHICCNGLRKNGYVTDFMYDKSHYNHPINDWVAEAYMNFQWVRTLGLALNQEYKDRTGKTEEYGSYKVMLALDPDPSVFPQVEATEQPQCFEKFPQCKRDDPVSGYREYFRQVKGPKSEWNHVPRPHWLDGPDEDREPIEPHTEGDSSSEEPDEIPDTGLESFRT